MPLNIDLMILQCARCGEDRERAFGKSFAETTIDLIPEADMQKVYLCKDCRRFADVQPEIVRLQSLYNLAMQSDLSLAERKSMKKRIHDAFERASRSDGVPF